MKSNEKRKKPYGSVRKQIPRPEEEFSSKKDYSRKQKHKHNNKDFIDED